MSRSFAVLFVVVSALIVPRQVVAQGADASEIHGVVRDVSGSATPGVTVRVVSDVAGTTREAVTDADGTYVIRAVPTGGYRLEATLDGFETATRRGSLAVGQQAAIDVVLSPARLSSDVVVTARRVEETAQEVPIPLSVVSGELVDERRRLQRQPPQGTDSDGPVLLDEPAQLVDQHPRHRRSVRPDERRHRTRRRPVHRRRVLRASGSGDARLPRRRTDRSAARSAGHAVRQEHHGRRDQRHDPQAELHAGDRPRAESRRRWGSCRPRHRCRAAVQERRRPAVVLRHTARRV